MGMKNVYWCTAEVAGSTAQTVHYRPVLLGSHDLDCPAEFEKQLRNGTKTKVSGLCPPRSR
jgi:hypothetical protein